MRCPSCGYGESKVVDSRPADDGASIRRRRECLECGNRFTTYERLGDVPTSSTELITPASTRRSALYLRIVASTSDIRMPGRMIENI